MDEKQQLHLIEEEKHMLAEQVKGLVKAETKLYEKQQEMDFRFRIFQKLYEYGKTFAAAIEIDDIFKNAIEFVIYVLEFQCCQIYLYDASNKTFRFHMQDGIYDDDMMDKISQLSLSDQDPFIEELINAKSIIAMENDDRYLSLREKFCLNEFAAYVLNGTANYPHAMAVIGNQADNYDYSTRIQLESDMMMGLGNLMTQITTNINNLKYHQDLQRTMEIKHHAEILTKEMELARRIQTSLLPSGIANIHDDFIIAAEMLTAEKVGGDFYDIMFDRSGHLWIAIGDVSGHGVTPGLIMMMAQTAHVTVTTNIDCDARNVIIKINEILYGNVHDRLEEKHFMTFCALKYLGQGRFEHSGAHLSIIVYRNRTHECELIKTKGIYMNFKRDISKPTKNAYFELEPGDILVLYTDGLTEAVNERGELFDIDRLTGSVKTHADLTPEDMKSRIIADVLAWSRNKKDDDMTLVVIKRKGS